MVTSIYSGGFLSIFDDANSSSITVSRNAAGTILVNGGAVPTRGGTPTIANTTAIQIFGQAGNDTITLDETNGALPRVNMFGGAGNDTMTGGSGADFLFGQSGNDTLAGKAGNDLLFGGDGNDVLTGGDGNDQMFGEAGNDQMIWNPGDDSDLMEGGAGTDTAEVNGGNGAETFTITANGARVRLDRVDPAPFNLDIGTTENLVLNANGGDDVIIAGNGLASLIKLTIDGGAGNDTITGGDGADVLIGGDGNDIVTGGRGADVALLGAGNDTFVWNPGDGNDTVEGQAGTDTLDFRGANISENFEISANGGRALFTRDIANIVMDLNDVETVEVAALGGADSVTVNDLTGTDVTKVDIDLAGTLGGAAGDAQLDSVRVRGTNAADIVEITGAGTSLSVTGLAALVTIENAEAQDQVIVEGAGGNDTIDAATLVAGIATLTIDGGTGNDTIHGSRGADILLGGDGNDFIDGHQGNDVAFLGAGDDVFQWDPGDGSDTVDGQDGSDTLAFHGANIGENIDISANADHARFFRDVASITMDLNHVETIHFDALLGADNIVVNDLTGTDVTKVEIDLAGTLGGNAGDGADDAVLVHGTGGADTNIHLSIANGALVVDGLAAEVSIAHFDSSDTVTIRGDGGDDKIDASDIGAGGPHLVLEGGAGADLLIGSGGDDVVTGGTGNDVAFLGAGDDTFTWNPGDGSDTVEGQAGIDTLHFNGANVSETIDISANGGRVLFSRDVGNVKMDLNDVETIDFHAAGGADNIAVNDLSGTDAKTVSLDLAGTIGGTTGDNQVDTITVNATNGDDVIQIIGDASGGIQITGLATQIDIRHFDANDRLVINGLGGDDVIEASGLNGVLLTANGGDGADVLIGSAGNDTLTGGAGDDVLIGGGGQDVLDGGPGDNIVIQSLVAQVDHFVV